MTAVSCSKKHFVTCVNDLEEIWYGSHLCQNWVQYENLNPPAPELNSALPSLYWRTSRNLSGKLHMLLCTHVNRDVRINVS